MGGDTRLEALQTLDFGCDSGWVLSNPLLGFYSELVSAEGRDHTLYLLPRSPVAFSLSAAGPLFPRVPSQPHGEVRRCFHLAPDTILLRFCCAVVTARGQ